MLITLPCGETIESDGIIAILDPKSSDLPYQSVVVYKDTVVEERRGTFGSYQRMERNRQVTVDNAPDVVSKILAQQGLTHGPTR